MDMVKLSNLASDEAKAEGFLRERGILIRFAQFFGILERGGKVKVEVVKDIKAENLLRETINKRGSLIYQVQGL